MKPTVEDLQDTFKIGYEAYESSKLEADLVWDNYHNRQYTDAQLVLLDNRGQPAETFNVVKLFSRMLLGYYSTVVNTAVASPASDQHVPTASLINDALAYTFRDNRFGSEGDKVKLEGILSGLFCVHIDVVKTGEKDRFGRPIRRIILEYVPENQLVLDPMSTKDDYAEDARYQHRFKWVREEALVKLYGRKKVDQLEEYFNHLNIDQAEFEYQYDQRFNGKYKIYNNYLVVHSVTIDENGKSWSTHWCGDIILYQKEVTHKKLKFPYRVVKLQATSQAEYYGLFREVIESQKAINQALIKLQLLVNTQKVFVEEGAVDNFADFTNAVNRVSGVIEVQDLSGIKVENLSKDVLELYNVIDKAFDRIQRILHINDSFLGMAFASDSGRKVKLQQNATITALRYLTVRMEQFYHLLGWDIVNLMQQYYTAEDVMRIADETTGDRWVTLNQPMQIPTGEIDPQTGEPEMEYVFEEVIDPDTGKPMIDDEGNYVIAPIPEGETEIATSKVEIEISTAAYNDEDEKNQLMLETIISGTTGQLLAQVNPAGFFQVASLSIKSMKTKNSPEISKIFNDTAVMLGGNPEATQEAKMMASGVKGTASQPKSESMGLPQNTRNME